MIGPDGMPDMPAAELDPVRRLRVLSRSMEGVALRERVFDVPFTEVWSWIADLERSIPAFDPLVWRLRVLRRDGERLRIRSWPSPVPFDVVLREGWCWMHSPVFVVGMAAVPEGPDRTRFAHLEGFPLAGPPWWRRLARPLVRWMVAGHERRVTDDLNGMERELAKRARPEPVVADPAPLPAVTLDPIQRLEVISRTLDGVAMAEITLDAPFDSVWRWVTDFEHSPARADRDVWRVRIIWRRRHDHGERILLRAWPAPFRFDVELREGWCWMHSPAYVVGMAAVPDGPDRTRYAHLEGIPTPGRPVARRLLAPFAYISRRRHQWHVPHDLAGIAREIERDGLSGRHLVES